MATTQHLYGQYRFAAVWAFVLVYVEVTLKNQGYKNTNKRYGNENNIDLFSITILFQKTKESNETKLYILI